ncbi:MAG TPA: glycoside hydrolase family 38 C-terminal domain-containing protein [Chloroflexota bacterium]|nr:glycoside hydrolase family 38 C-terminal domain-containing protein [Chloroflexota bacterium]
MGDTRAGDGIRGVNRSAGPKSTTLDMIGNAHLDPVWLWQWQEGFQAAKATFRSVLTLMDEYDDFVFTSSSAALYEWIEQNDPDMFAAIKRRVIEGRWEIVGGWWMQPDCNLPGGESFVRHGLYGQRYFSEKLGVTATVGYNVDSFGHAGSLPQILRKSGMRAYVFMRPHPHEQRLPSRLFWWESDDGSRVLTYRIPYEYCTWGKRLQQQVERTASELKGSTDRLMCFYGVGNHGGGPTRENIDSIREMNADPDYPTLLFSSPSRFFKAEARKERELPVVHDELQHHASGCYSAHSAVKRWNRLAENRLIVAEKLSALAMQVTGHPYGSDFGRAWKDVLFNQFHDILAGTSIEPAYEDARNLYGEALAIAGRNLNDAVQAISWRIDLAEEPDSTPIVVFNPHSWGTTAMVELEYGRLDGDEVLLDVDGNPVAWQRVRSLATVSSGSRNRICFQARLPAYGYTVYRLRRGSGETSFPVVPAGDTWMENARLRLEVDPVTGYLRSLYDKQLGFEFVRDAAARPLVMDDRSDTWSHGVLRYADRAGEFRASSVRLIEQGPVRSTIRVESAFEASKLTQDLTLQAEGGRVDVAVTVDWHERFKVLKLNFPINIFFSNATYETPYGFIHRPANGEEEPGQSWVDLTGVGRNDGRLLGMSLLNDGKYSFDLTEKEINLTVLRSPIYAHHTPYEPADREEYTFLDQGMQRFTYSLLPHAGGWEDAGTIQAALELNQPPIAIVESIHHGPLPLRASYLDVDQENVIVTAVKRAEDGDDLVVRCFETTGMECEATLAFPYWNRQIEAEFRPSELKTFRLPVDPNRPVTESNLIEWEDD